MNLHLTMLKSILVDGLSCQCTMAAVTMHHFSGLGAPFMRSKGTVSGGVFNQSAGRFFMK